MIQIDYEKIYLPLFVGVGLIISQLFMYGKKVKRRVKITVPELVGDLMQFGVRMAITISTIKFMQSVAGVKINDMWQVVATTILICTSFDTYFTKLREIMLSRALGAAGVLIGKIPENSAVKVSAGKGLPDNIDIHVMTDDSDAMNRAGRPLKTSYRPIHKIDSAMKKSLIDLGDDQE